MNTTSRLLIPSLFGVAALTASAAADSSATLSPHELPKVGTVDTRYVSYNLEMLEVTGGKFWKAYGPALNAALKQPTPSASPAEDGDTPAGMNPALYEYRPPIDLTNKRLRKLAAALGPAYVRVSGTWANTSYFPDSDTGPQKPPAGFSGVLTRAQWKGVIEFSKAVDAGIVTSFATSVGTRDANGVWNTEQAKRFVDYTKWVGGHIAAAEFMNEPTFAAMGGAPASYDAAAYGRDFKIFHTFAKEAVPNMLILGPGSVGETTGEWGVAYGMNQMLNTRDLLAASEPAKIDRFSYHHYGASSIRCAAMGGQTTADDALSEQWLARTDETLAFYRKLRDEFEPGKSFWLTETADAACGGNPWGATFLDTFRYVDQLGRLAKQDVQVVMHNTLVASDYGLLDEQTLTPKPNYWGALVWHKLMGATVLDCGIPIQEGLHVYAHNLRDKPGGVAVLVINNSRAKTTSLNVALKTERYTLSAPKPDGKEVDLNGHQLKLQTNDELPKLQEQYTSPGRVDFAPATITFLAIPDAANPNSTK